MELREIGEFGLIARVRRILPSLPSNVGLGIGDDAAVSALTPGSQLVSTVDLLAEGVHFDLSLISPRLLGRKSLAVNLSDIAAMGAVPLFSLISIAIPLRLQVEWVDEFFEGFLGMAGEYGVSLIGGDTSASPDRLFISVTLLGEGKKEALVYRHGAKPGDDLYITGTLGDSLLGLQLAKAGGSKRSSPEVAHLLARHFDPVPRVHEGKALAEKGLATAMIDVSDGLLSDLTHVCEESKVGATVWVEKIPQSAALRSVAPSFPRPIWQWAVQGGEDYELLFSAPPGKAAEILNLARQWKCGVTQIGKVEIPGRGVVVQDKSGPIDSASLKGFDHFA